MNDRCDGNLRNNVINIWQSWWARWCWCCSDAGVLYWPEIRSDSPASPLRLGFLYLIMAYSIGSISGCHINPAVTIGLMVAKRIAPKEAIMYVLAQSVGAVAGAAILYLIASGKAGYDLATHGLGQNGFDAASPGGYNMQAAFITELVLTAIFIFVILGATCSAAPAGFAGLAIGIALVVIHLVAIPVTGTSVNPARSLGPALLAGGTALSQLWLFWVAPLLGGCAGALLWKMVFCDVCKKG